jgi:TonB family protein
LNATSRETGRRSWRAAALLCLFAHAATAAEPLPLAPLEVRIEVLGPGGKLVGWVDPEKQFAFRLGFVAGAIYGPVVKRAQDIQGERGRRVQIDLANLAREAEAAAATLRADLKEKGLRVEPEETRFARVSNGARIIGVDEVNVSGFVSMKDGTLLHLAWFDRPCRIRGEHETSTSVTEYAIEIEKAGLHWIWDEFIGDKRHRIRNVDTAGDLALVARLGTTKKDTGATSAIVRIEAPQPAYPEELRVSNKEGKVVAWVYVDAKGEVFAVSVRKSDDEAFSRAALAAFSRWRFRPATRDDKPAPFIGEFEVLFKLTD